MFKPYQKQMDYEINLRIYDHNSNTFVSLERKDYIKYLGILIYSNLTWNSHIGYITSKVSKTLGIISRLRHFVPSNTLLNIYQSITQPFLTYGTNNRGWSCSITHLNKNLNLQKLCSSLTDSFCTFQITGNPFVSQL